MTFGDFGNLVCHDPLYFPRSESRMSDFPNAFLALKAEHVPEKAHEMILD